MSTNRTNRKMVTAGLLAALFIGALDVTVVSTAMPHIVKDLSGIHLVSWVFSIYTLTTCVATPIFGKLTDLFGRRTVFTIGLALFILGSILSGAAGTMTALIWFRAVQGIGAGALTPVTFTIIGDIYPGEQRGKMQGVFASVWSVAGLLGPLVGGAFVDYMSWRWIFYINGPIGVLAFILVFYNLHEQFERKKKSIDYAGAFVFTLGISSLLYALLNGGGKYAWDSGAIIGLFAVSVVSLILFVLIERKAREAMIPLSIFRNPVMNVSNLSGFFAFSITIGTSMYAPMWIQNVRGYSATASGFLVMSTSIAWPIAANLAGRYMFKRGAKSIMVIGALAVLTGTIWLSAIAVESPVWFITVILGIIGFGMGCVSTPATVLIQSAVGWEMRGVATATNSLMRSLGQTVAAAIYGTILNQHLVHNTPDEMADGMRTIFLAMLVIAALNLLVVVFLPSQARAGETNKSTP